MKIILIGLILWCSLTAFAQGHQHGATPMAAEDGDYNPSLAADPRGGFYLAYVQRLKGVSNIMLRHSIDGENFSAPVRVNDREGDATVRNENPPKIAIGTRGEIYLCWANERERWKGNIRFARSLDQGRTFSPAVTLNSDSEKAPVGHAFQSIAVDAKGRIHVAWIDERQKRQEDRGAEIWLATSNDRGKSFSANHRILSDVCECCRTNLQTDAAGNLYLAYRTVPATGPMYRDIIVARSQDGGQTFTPKVVSADQWEINGCPVAGPGLSVDQSGKITVVWFMGGSHQPGLYFATSTDQGLSFAPRKWLTSDQRMGKHAQLALTQSNEILVIWDDTKEKTFSSWGKLKISSQSKLQTTGQELGISYPVIATNKDKAVVAGVRLATRELFLQKFSLN